MPGLDQDGAAFATVGTSEQVIIPAQAGIQRVGKSQRRLNSCFRRNDGKKLVQTIPERLVLARMSTAQPAIGWIADMLILEHALHHDDLLATVVTVGVEERAGCPERQRRMFGTELVQWHDQKARHHARQLRRIADIHHHTRPIGWIEVAKLHKNHTASR